MSQQANKVLLIGAGGIGSRHLQGLKKSNVPIEIEVVDPSSSSIEIAKERYGEIEINENIKQINYYPNIEDASDNIDLSIVATTSEIRYPVVKELLKNKVVNNLVLEKVLFQTIDAYTEIKNLLEYKNVKCWVNHPRRMYPFYIELKKKLLNANRVSLNYHGGDWGLACNGLHHIDLLAYLVDSQNVELNSVYLDQEIFSSKRKKFKEVFGLLNGKINNHLFSLSSLDCSSPSLLSIVSDNLFLRINENKEEIIICDKVDNWVERRKSEKIIYFQSELTHIFVEDILLNGICDLVSYQDACKLHVPFIHCLKDHFENVSGVKMNSCPIT